VRIRVKGSTIRHTFYIKLRQNGTKSWTNTVQTVTVGVHTDVTSCSMDLNQAVYPPTFVIRLGKQTLHTLRIIQLLLWICGFDISVGQFYLLGVRRPLPVHEILLSRTRRVFFFLQFFLLLVSLPLRLDRLFSSVFLRSLNKGFRNVSTFTL
jgi:hypothetical protein